MCGRRIGVVPEVKWSAPVGRGEIGTAVIILGIILLILGAVLDVPILYTIGIILLIVGAILWILGSMDRGIGGRRHYF